MSYGYEMDTGENQGLSNRQLALIFGISIVGIFMVFALFVFPIQNLLRESITEQVTIIRNVLLTVKIILEEFLTVTMILVINCRLHTSMELLQ